MSGTSHSPSVPDSLRWDDEHDEPYLLIPGHDNIRLTPYRPGDDEEVVKMYNDPMIGQWAFRRPYPFLPEDMSFIWDVIYPACKATAATLKPVLQTRQHPLSANGGASSLGERSLPFAFVPGFPFSVVRDVTTGRVIGTFALFTYVPPASESDPAPAAAAASPADAAEAAKNMFAGRGQESVPPRDQVWEMAYDLSEGARGKGYSVPIVKSALENWARWVGIGAVRAGVETTNLGSQAVVRKSGLQFLGSRYQDWPIEKGGGRRELGQWEIKLV